MTASGAAIRCLIVEDQTILRQLLVGLLEQWQEQIVVASAPSVAEGIAACTTFQPDLLILDMALPDGDGFDVAFALQQLNPSAQVFVLSSFASTVVRPAELKEMVTAILDKNQGIETLLDEVRNLLPTLTPAVSDLEAVLAQLTKRELEVLLLLGEAKTSKMIASILNISLRTVETHRRNLCSKLNLSGAALIRLAALACERRSYSLEPVSSCVS